MAPKDFQFRKVNDDQVIFYRLIIDESAFSTNIESISIESDLHVKLSHKGNIVPLPDWFRSIVPLSDWFRSIVPLSDWFRSIVPLSDWFRSNNNCRLTYVSMLDNLKELNNLSYYKPQGRVRYSYELIRCALMQHYTSRQSYELLLHEFPLPSFSYLKSLTKGGIEPIKGLKLLLQEGKVSSDSALLIDYMYLQKSAQYHGGKLIGKDEKGDFYNGILVFMIAGLKQSVPYVIKACPKTRLSGRWLTDEIEESLSTLSDGGLRIHAIITDNHSTNVTACKMLITDNHATNVTAFKMLITDNHSTNVTAFKMLITDNHSTNVTACKMLITDNHSTNVTACKMLITDNHSTNVTAFKMLITDNHSTNVTACKMLITDNHSTNVTACKMLITDNDATNVTAFKMLITDNHSTNVTACKMLITDNHATNVTAFKMLITDNHWLTNVVLLVKC